MTTTPNLTLPQWDKTDRIMMDDFNTAMANIDAGFYTRLGPGELIASVPFGGNITTIDFTGIDWSDWSVIYVVMDGGRSAGEEMTYRFRCTLNNDTVAGRCSADNSYFAYPGVGPLAFIFYPWRNPDSSVFAFCVGMNGGLCYGDITYAEFQNIYMLHGGLTSDGPIQIFGIH